MRKYWRQIWLVGFSIAVLVSCGGTQNAKQQGADKGKQSDSGTSGEGQMSWQKQAESFLSQYLEDFERLEGVQMKAHWQAAVSGEQKDYDALSAADLAVKKLHSDGEKYKNLEELLSHREELEPLTTRSLEVAYLEFKGSQLPLDLLEKIVRASSDIHRIFNTFRGAIGKEQFTNNELLEMLAKEKSSKKRRRIWEAMKQVGAMVGPKIVALAKQRNLAAQKLEYKNFWEMEVRLQDHDPNNLLSIFEELEKLTDEPFKVMKAELDQELKRKFKVKKSDALMPWHYDNPFFQAPPPSEKVDLDVFYKDRKKEDIVKIAEDFFKDIGMPIDKIVKNSDLYEREGKDQHAFCIDIDRNGDVRTLLNIKPNVEWMDTMLHEQGHAVYDSYLDFSLPFNLREAAHIFTTEAVAMLFGALAKNATWIADFANGDREQLRKQADAVREQRRREQLTFARWTMVMFYFEKAMYENPEQDLNKLWWDMVERFQMVPRPKDRDASDWASKPHFTIAPVYYHNYMLGELFAAQLRVALRKAAGHAGPASSLSYKGQSSFGDFFKEKVFKPSKRHRWPEFILQATGEKLTAKYFAMELKK